MPLGLLSLAAGLLQNKIRVNIYQPSIRLFTPINYREAAKDILKSRPTIIGFSTWGISYPATLLLAREIKNIAPQVPIVFGGPQASIVAEETLRNFQFVDFVLAGEADFSFPSFVREINQHKPDFSGISGLCYKSTKGTILKNPISGWIKNLDELPVPAYHLVPQIQWIKLDVGRGCPFECTYCSTSLFFSKKYRIKTADRIFNEMISAWQTKKNTSFSFAHDMFTLNKKQVIDLCNKLIVFQRSNHIKFKWNCSARIDFVSAVLLEKMKAAGCNDLFFGIETGSERMQQIIKKNLDINRVYEIAKICRKLEIRMHASFIIGFPEESKTDLNTTLKTIFNLAKKGILVQVSELSLLPGTPLFKQHFKNLKFDGKFSNFSRNFCGEPEVELIKTYPEIFASFYHLPVKTLNRNEMFLLRIFINKLKDFRNTLYLLSDLLEVDFANSDLVDLIKTEIKKQPLKPEEPGAVSLWFIKLLDHYIAKNSTRINNKFLADVFAVESYTTLLFSLRASWDFVQPAPHQQKFDHDFTIFPSPVWKVLTLNYKADKILPSENGWKKNPAQIKKGIYSYLLVAESTTKCKRIRMDKTDLHLLKMLTNCSFEEYLRKTGSQDNRPELLQWLKKMQKLGVITLVQANKKEKKEPEFSKSV
jgi:radical SAM superfamily enzyme YgiQ (UPF0313 family)